jgi:hypothetical protein
MFILNELCLPLSIFVKKIAPLHLQRHVPLGMLHLVRYIYFFMQYFFKLRQLRH